MRPTANTIWLTGITEHPTDEGKVDLCSVKDVYSTRRSCTPTAKANLPHDSSFRFCRTTDYMDRWAAAAYAATTPPWNRSSQFYKATYSTDNDSPPAPNYG